MKRFLSIFLCVTLLTLLAACAKDPAQNSVGQSAGAHKVGVSLTVESDFNLEYERQLKLIAAEYDVNLNVKYSGLNISNQLVNLDELIADGVEYMVILPVDVDSLDDPIVRCNETNIKTINLLDAINAQINTLISLDYKEIGKAAANMANSYLETQQNKNVLLVEGPLGSFSSQMVYDGFIEVAQGKGWSIDSVRGNNTTGKSNEELKKAFAAKDYSLVFSFGELMTEGVISGCSEISKTPQIITIDADMDTVKKIAEGAILGSVYVSPNELARITLDVIKNMMEGGQISSYKGVSIQTLTKNDAQNKIDEQAKHAN